MLTPSLLTELHGANLHLRNEETKPRNNLGSINNEHGAFLLHTSAAVQVRHRQVPTATAPCSSLWQLSLPHTNRSLASASDFLPGLFKDALSDAWGYYSKRGRHGFSCFQETPYYWTPSWPHLADCKEASWHLMPKWTWSKFIPCCSSDRRLLPFALRLFHTWNYPPLIPACLVKAA